AKKNIFGVYKYPAYTFTQFNAKVNQFCHQFISFGIKPGDRVLMFLKPDLDFSIITFALFRMGAVAIFIDPGMKRDYLFKCIQEVKPTALFGIPKIHLIRHFYPKVFKGIKLFVSTGKMPGFFCKSIYWGLKKHSEHFDSFIPQNEELAAILYTSGGTGAPKGVEYTHDIFINQTKMLKQEFSLTSEEIDIPGFPLFSFFTLAMGMTSCIPDINFAKPAECSAQVLYDNIKNSQATFLVGSPAIWDKLVDHCLQNNLKLNNVKYVVMFGAPINIKLHQKFSKVLTQGSTFTPYGATECLPVSNISGKTILSNFQQEFLSGQGVCVGKPLQGVKVKIIQMDNAIIPDLSKTVEVRDNSIGEIIVQSPNVTQKYFGDQGATDLAKTYEGKKVWHRMGDVGYFDENKNLWFCGRKKHVVIARDKLYYPLQVEPIFNKHPKIKRTALIKDDKNDVPHILIERVDGTLELDSMFIMDLKNLSKTHDKANEINSFSVVAKFPVDTRHNIKIDRTLLEQQYNGV
ncbi:MAG: AMP-binding protein, partial [Halobacteriovoraceae bacterium]|nr:AMP-binding protein [Halobacteriovoraceae bacterium]